MFIFDFRNLVIILIIESRIELTFISIKGQYHFNALHFSHSLTFSVSIIAVILINRYKSLYLIDHAFIFVEACNQRESFFLFFCLSDRSLVCKGHERLSYYSYVPQIVLVRRTNFNSNRISLPWCLSRFRNSCFQIKFRLNRGWHTIWNRWICRNYRKIF